MEKDNVVIGIDIDDMIEAEAETDFGTALLLLKEGHKVSRKGWNGKGMFLYYVPDASYPSRTEIAKEMGETVPYQAYIAMKTVDNTIVPWVASQTDILSEDWVILDDCEMTKNIDENIYEEIIKFVNIHSEICSEQFSKRKKVDPDKIIINTLLNELGRLIHEVEEVDNNINLLEHRYKESVDKMEDVQKRVQILKKEIDRHITYKDLVMWKEEVYQ